MQSIPPAGGGQGPAYRTTLFQEFKEDLKAFKSAFSQTRTGSRATKFILGLMLATGRKTCMASKYWRNEYDDETADLKVFSRSEWSVLDWFDAVLLRVLSFLDPTEPFVVGIDDSATPKTGKGLHNARNVHNPLAPKWMKQRIMWGVRFLHFSALLTFGYAALRPYSIPVSFLPRPAAKKPRRRNLSESELAEYQAAKKSTRLTRFASEGIQALRDRLNRLGQKTRRLLIVVDGSFMNGPVVAKAIPGVDIIGRIRGNARLFLKAVIRSRNQFYGDPLPTPEELEKDRSHHWKSIKVWWAGDIRDLQIKVLPEVYWKAGTKKRPMRLIVVKGTQYKPKTKRRRKRAGMKPVKFQMRKSGYLLTTDLTSDPAWLVQKALDRWQLEQVHRDVKTGLGIGHPQVHNPKSEDRLPSAMVAMYSLWALAVLRRYGPCWTPAAVPIRQRQLRRIEFLKRNGQRWERRFTYQDLIRILRSEVQMANLWPGDGPVAWAPPGYPLPVRTSFTV